MKEPLKYTKRTYRDFHDSSNLQPFHVKIKDTDLHILADSSIEERGLDLALQYRLQVEDYINRYPAFATTLLPVEQDLLAPPIVKEMIDSGLKAGVGPMAAVAGAISEYVGLSLLKEVCREVVVENGGDVFIARKSDATVAIFAGNSPLSMQVGIHVPQLSMPTGVCSSSGTVGHSLSFGLADSVTVVAKSTPLADAAATRLGNEITKARNNKEGIAEVLEISRTIDELMGVVIVCGDQVGAVGEIELVRID